MVVRILRAFGPVAGASVAVMVVTGLSLASAVVGSVDALLLTDYGRLLVVKVIVVLGCGVLALATRRRLHRSGGLGRLGLRLVVGEVILGGPVIDLTGLLSSGAGMSGLRRPDRVLPWPRHRDPCRGDASSPSSDRCASGGVERATSLGLNGRVRAATDTSWSWG